MNRPSLQQLIADVKAGRIGIVVVWKIDRLSRSLKHLINLVEILDENGVSFVSVQENMDFRGAMGKLVFNLFASIAEFERELIRGRTHMGKIASAKMGNFTGAWAPYGYQKIKNACGKGSRLQILERQAHWVHRIYRWYVYDQLGPERILEKLKSHDVPFDAESRAHRSSPREWTREIVDRILTNTIYRGTFVASMIDEAGAKLPESEWTIVDTPKIIEPVLWFEAQDCRKNRRTYHGKDIYLLTGKIIDRSASGCRRMSGVSRTKGGFSYRRKQFVNKDGDRYPSFEIPAAPLEDYIWALIREAVRAPERFLEAYQKQRRTSRDDENALKEWDSIQERLARIENYEIPRIQSAFEKGIYSEDSTMKRLGGKEGEIQTLRSRLQELQNIKESEAADETRLEGLKRVSETLGKRIDAFTRREKRTFCALLIDHISLWRVGERHRWDITGQVVFHFDLPSADPIGGRGGTEKALADAANGKKSAKMCPGGQPATQGYQKSSESASDRRGIKIDFEIVKLPKIVGSVVRSA